MKTLMQSMKTPIRLLLAITLAALIVIGSTPELLAQREGNESPDTRDDGPNYVDYVNSYIGTAYDRTIHAGTSEYGGMNPWVSTPFAMTKWLPQTRQNAIGTMPYRFDDTYITGFMATHQPAIWMGDFGYMTMMPGVDSVKTATGTGSTSRRLAFTHADETVSPYYYSVSMDAGSSRRIKTEIAAASRASIFKITYPQNDVSNLYIEMSRSNIAGSVSIDPAKQEISGYNTHRMDSHLCNLQLPKFKGYYVIQFSKPFSTYGSGSGSSLTANQASFTGNNAGAFVTFNTVAGEVVEVRIGMSFISPDQARENLRREAPASMSFDDLKESVRDIWNEKLGVIDIEGASYDDMVTFYTGLYHAMLFPAEFSEYGRYYGAFDDKIHNGESYTSFSIWDTFRAANSLITLTNPERVNGIVNALLNNYKQGGYMPKWPNPSYTNIMIGTHADSLVAEAVVKGFDGFDLELAYEACFKDGMVPPVGDLTTFWNDRLQNVPYEARSGLTYLLDIGYVPVDKTAEAASNTLEGAYDDYCIAQVAKALGKMDDYEYFMNRAQYYKNLYHADTGLLRGKNLNGTWANAGSGWTEGSQWNYTYCVLQDLGGLRELMGKTGSEYEYNIKLDDYFASGRNDQRNEPSHHYGYLYDFSGQPWKTQKMVRQIARGNYCNDPARGLTGNEDCGQMSAWFVFTAMGFYPVNPASAEYMIGSPMFDKATLHMPGGKDFEIIAHNNSETNVYIQSAKLNGDPLDIPVITHADIVAGGTLEFWMGGTASTWGSSYLPEPLVTYSNVSVPVVPDEMKHKVAGTTDGRPFENKNLALKSTCTATSYQTADIGGTPDKIVDGRLVTGLLSRDNQVPTAANPHYVTLTWDEPQSFNRMTLYANYAQNQAPRTWDIQYSIDGVSNWTNATFVGKRDSVNCTWTTNYEAPCEGVEIWFDRVVNAKGFRISITAAYLTWNHYTIHEIGIYDYDPVSFGDIAVLAACSSTNETTGKDIGGEAFNVNNGLITKGLISTDNPGLPQYITLVWPTPQSFDAMKLFTNFNRSQGPTNWDIEVSEDGATGWRLVKNSGTAPWKTSTEAAEGTMVTFDLVRNVKGLRIKINSANLSFSHYAVREIEVYRLNDTALDTEIKLDVVGGKATANYIAVNASGRDWLEAWCIIAVYNPGGALKHIEKELITVFPSDNDSLRLSVPIVAGETVKAFIWDAKTFVPLCSAAEAAG